MVITGKSEQPTQTLPGSIHTVVEEISAAGGRAIAVRLDVREEDEVAAMVQHTVDELGSLDILVNNAGALRWKPVLETPVKRYDLMWEVNVRGSPTCAQQALHLAVSHDPRRRACRDRQQRTAGPDRQAIARRAVPA